ncbi:hypothetical protein HPP92_015894 [Vanilla planifolia]|uniref:Uncharacterized protein n=1 Tax=Vanilla planifolia TaxID=51239 RepID=A0A835URC6_VANPL|nr:hypothetical protein HPP92_016525 [Vanilla planifolia]KAG0471348.1 hypothetical protein HPP92_015894 [Vanilla planifolia]
MTEPPSSSSEEDEDEPVELKSTEVTVEDLPVAAPGRTEESRRTSNLHLCQVKAVIKGAGGGG